MLSRPANSHVPGEEARQWHAIVGASELLESSIMLTRLIVTSDLPRQFTHAQGPFWIGRYVVCTQLLCFRTRDTFTGGNPKPAAFSAGSVIGHTQFIGAGEYLGYIRVSMNVRAEVGKVDKQILVWLGSSILCSLGNVGAPGRRLIVSEKWWSVNYLGVLLTLEDLHL